MIKFGPAGIGAVKDAVGNLEEFSKLGLKACEIAFTYGVYIKDENDMKKIKEASRRFGIKLSIHAPYWINLNSKEKMKIKQSKERILRCCSAGDKLGADTVVFHPGYYGGMDKEETYQNIKREILEMIGEIKAQEWDIKLAPETTGKNNVFGSIEEIKKLVDETKCSFTLDFAHILAREKSVDFEKIKKLFGEFNKWHCHFSGIEYGEKGEKKHVLTSGEKWRWLLDKLPRDKEIIIINESPDPVGDSVSGLRILGGN